MAACVESSCARRPLTYFFDDEIRDRKMVNLWGYVTRKYTENYKSNRVDYYYYYYPSFYY